MVTATIDPIRIPVLNLTGEELDDIEAQIAEGKLPPNYLELHREAVARNIFGHDAKKDRDGSYREQGIGSEFGMTRNSINAYKRHCQNEPDFERHLARMEKQLLAANDRRRQAAGK